jgi:hypothetical protein
MHPALPGRPVVTVSFTAARKFDAGGQNTIINVLTAHLPYADRYVTGACTGGDALIGLWLVTHRRGARHVVVVPANRSRIDPWWEPFAAGTVEVIEMPPGTTYADRNQRLVNEGTMLFGFPGYPEADPRSDRSGSWQAIRMSRAAHKLSMWHCVQPPYAGRIERWPREFLPQETGHG